MNEEAFLDAAENGDIETIRQGLEQGIYSGRDSRS